jgi:hypothetical protein
VMAAARTIQQLVNDSGRTVEGPNQEYLKEWEACMKAYPPLYAALVRNRGS